MYAYLCVKERERERERGGCVVWQSPAGVALGAARTIGWQQPPLRSRSGSVRSAPKVGQPGLVWAAV